jgi:transposase
MRGQEQNQSSMLCMLSPSSRVPSDHPLRQIKKLVDAILKEMSPLFDAMYATRGRPSIPPETLLKSSLLMALYSVRSERQFCEQLDYNLMYRWFLDMDMTAPSFDASTFAKNRVRLMEHAVAEEFFQLAVAAARGAKLVSREHFTVDGTLIGANASMKSFKKKNAKKDPNPPDDRGNPSVDFHGEKRSNETHASTTEPENSKRRSCHLCGSISIRKSRISASSSSCFAQKRVAN